MKPSYEEYGIVEAIKGWIRDRAIYFGYYDPVEVKVRMLDLMATEARKAHEYGHYMGLGHEPWYKFDMMSTFTIRLYDRHECMNKSRAWRAMIATGEL